MEESSVLEAIRALFCIDVDGTLIDGNTHNHIWNAINLSTIIRDNGGNNIEWTSIESRVAQLAKKTNPPQPISYWETLFKTLMDNTIWETVRTNEDHQWLLVKDMRPIGDPQKWHEAFHTLIEDGHDIAMVSFSSFGNHIIPRYLKEIIKLDESFIAKHITVISSLPDLNDPTKRNKNAHMDEATQKTKSGKNSYLPHEMVLIDDDERDNIPSARARKFHTIPAQHNGSHIDKILDLSKKIKNPPVVKKENKYERKYLSSSSESSKSPQRPTHLLSKSMEKLLNLSLSRSPSPQRTPDQPTQRMALTKSRENIK